MTRKPSEQWYNMYYLVTKKVYHYHMTKVSLLLRYIGNKKEYMQVLCFHNLSNARSKKDSWTRIYVPRVRTHWQITAFRGFCNVNFVLVFEANVGNIISVNVVKAVVSNSFFYNNSIWTWILQITHGLSVIPLYLIRVRNLELIGLFFYTEN